VSYRDVGELLIGDSPAMRQLRALIVRVASSELPVLIQGETGVGKELVTRALHHASDRPGALVSFNVCAVADTMFEDALFGHVRGAYTGAVQSTPGYMTEAHRGTLFLDEISGLSVVNQLKLLRAVESKEFRPVGASADRRSDFRVVAASNEDLPALVAAGRFRQDLLHRLGAVRLLVPPLRERRSDIPLLIRTFAARASAAGADLVVDGAALKILQAHSWPGNVREVRHVVEAMLTLTDGGIVRVDDVAPLLAGAAAPLRARRRREDERLLAMLDATAWDVDEVARRLGVHRATVYRRLKRLGGEVPPALSLTDDPDCSAPGVALA
jgi:DNA-binding NtrC family response regulator